MCIPNSNAVMDSMTIYTLQFSEDNLHSEVNFISEQLEDINKGGSYFEIYKL